MKTILISLFTTLVIAAVLCPLAYLERGYIAVGGEGFAAILGGLIVAVRQFEKRSAEVKKG